MEIILHFTTFVLPMKIKNKIIHKNQNSFICLQDIGNLVRRAHDMEGKIPSSRDQIFLLQEYDVMDLTLKELEHLLQQLEGKYHGIMQ